MRRLATACAAIAFSCAAFTCAPLAAHAIESTAEESHADSLAVEIAAVEEGSVSSDATVLGGSLGNIEVSIDAQGPSFGSEASVEEADEPESAAFETASINYEAASTQIVSGNDPAGQNQGTDTESTLTIASMAPPEPDDPYEYIYFEIEILDDADPSLVTLQTDAYAKRLKTDTNGLFVFSRSVDAPTAPEGMEIDEAATASGIYFAGDGGTGSKTYASSASYTVSGNSALVTASVVNGNYGAIVITNKYRAVTTPGGQQASTAESGSSAQEGAESSSAGSTTGGSGSAAANEGSDSPSESSATDSGNAPVGDSENASEAAGTNANSTSTTATASAGSVDNTSSTTYAPSIQYAGNIGLATYAQDFEDEPYSGGADIASPLSLITPQAAEAAELNTTPANAVQTPTGSSETLSEGSNQSQGAQTPILLIAGAAAAVLALGAGAGVAIARRRH